MQFQLIYITVLLVGAVFCENNNLEKLQDVENNLILKHFNQISIKDLKDTIEKQCEKNGGPTAYGNLETATMDFQSCIQSNLNLAQIGPEIVESRRTASLDEVIAKYCIKTPIVQKCIHNLLQSAEPCLDQEEKPSLKLYLNITAAIAKFVCFKHGDRLATFVDEGGLDCIQSKKEGLEKCLRKTYTHHISSQLPLNQMPSLVFNRESCIDYTNLQHCVVKVLETCENKAPANFVGGLFKYVHKSMPCRNQKRVLRSFGHQQEMSAVNVVFEQVREKFEPHCSKNGGPGAVEEFNRALEQVKTCSNMTQSSFTKKMQEAKGIPFDYMCKDFRFGIRGCLSTLTDKMEACTSRAERYVPKFGMELYDSVFSFYCKDDARALKKFLGERDMCMNKIHNSTNFCLGRTKHIKVYAKDDVVTKHELCADLKILKNCFLDVAIQQCAGNVNTNEFVNGLSDAIYAPCSGYQILATNLLLLLVMVVQKVF